MKFIGSILLVIFLFFFIKKDKSGLKNYPTQPQDTLQLDSFKKDSVFIKLDTIPKKDSTSDSINRNIIYGIASFYSRSLDSTETATGEIFSHKKLTAASNRYKLNTWVRVTRLKNGKSIIVRINDRMHPRMDKKGRVVDLSILGATRLGFIKTGITKVKVEIVPKGTLK